jgi:hypothetical protein
MHRTILAMRITRSKVRAKTPAVDGQERSFPGHDPWRCPMAQSLSPLPTRRLPGPDERVRIELKKRRSFAGAGRVAHALSRTQAMRSRVKTVPCCRPARRRCRSPPVFAPRWQLVELNHVVRPGVDTEREGATSRSTLQHGIVASRGVTNNTAASQSIAPTTSSTSITSPCAPLWSGFPYPERRLMGPCLRRLHL